MRVGEISGDGSGGPQIQVDAGATQDASDALRRLAAAMSESADVFGRQLPTVTTDWQGSLRDQFDPEAAGYLAEAAGVVVGLLGLASAIEAATEEALLYNQAVQNAQASHQPLPPRPAPVGP